MGRRQQPAQTPLHTQSDVICEWNRAYSRDQAVFPLEWVRDNKFWPSVNRIDDVYGDRNPDVPQARAWRTISNFGAADAILLACWRDLAARFAGDRCAGLWALRLSV